MFCAMMWVGVGLLALTILGISERARRARATGLGIGQRRLRVR